MPKPPALDPMTLRAHRGSKSYPEPFKAAVLGREKRLVGEALGLKNYGVNLTTLEPGAISSHRHWHSRQDEFIYMLKGELVLVTDAGEQVLTPGMVAGFPAGVADGHQLVNRSAKPATYLEVGDRLPGDEVAYPDVDLKAFQDDGPFVFTRKDGTPY